MLQRWIRRTTLALLAAAALSGCSAGGGLRGYFFDRIDDALDVFGLQFAVGPSVFAEAQFGRYVHISTGLAVGGTDWIGLINGQFTTQPASATYGFPCSNAFVIATIAADPTMEFDAALVACFFCTKVVDAGDDGYLCLCFVPAKIPPGYDRTTLATRAFDISIELSVGVRVRATFSPGEGIDFLLGFLGSDLAGDDGRSGPPGPHSESAN